MGAAWFGLRLGHSGLLVDDLDSVAVDVDMDMDMDMGVYINMKNE